MGLCSHALFSNLALDLSAALPSVPFERFFKGNLRAAEWPGCSARDVACLSLADSLLKKFKDAKAKDADAKALTKFLEANTHCGHFAKIDETLLSEIQAVALGEFRKCFYDFWFTKSGDYWLDMDKIMSGLAVGPGSSIGATGDSFYHKVASSPLTGTQGSLFALYKRETDKYPLWQETEKIRSSHFGDYTPVPGCRLAFVPKTSEISRTICTEPLLNMLVQKGIAHQLELRLKSRFHIDLALQPDKNRGLAKKGSKWRTYGTIDLSSASDTISLGLMKQIMPKYVLSWLMECRSPKVELPDGSILDLHMVSSMGNAFTFPLQTILFSCLVVGAYKALNIEPAYPKGKDWGNFAVFGDDIIVRREAYDLVCNLLGRLGFFVNTDKSYNVGPFRESCGADFWSGVDVRGIYCQSLKQPQDVYSLINRLNVWSANHDVALPNTLSYLIDESGISIMPVPPWESDVAGLKMPFWMASQRLVRRSKDCQSIVYTAYTPRPRTTDLISVETRVPRWARKKKNGRNVILNHTGILWSALGGYLRDGRISYRQDPTYYKKRVRIAPGWDYIDTCHSKLTSDGWQRWKSTSVWLNAGRRLVAFVCSHQT